MSIASSQRRPVLVIGRDGQVARALASLSTPDLPVIALGRLDGVDLAAPATLAAALDANRPEVVVNAAAYTAVDQAESEPHIAFAVNARGVGALASLASDRAIPLIHISTGHVFDGRKPSPYIEDDPVTPLGVYGASQAAGETAIRDAGDEHVILRTAWIYSPAGGNFVRTMLRLAAIRDEIRVVGDQVGNPTAAGEIAQAIRRVVLSLREGGRSYGTFHIAGRGDTDWHGFAAAIFAAAGRHGHRIPELVRITTGDQPTAARRPANSRLDTSRLATVYGIGLPAWQDSLEEVVHDILMGQMETA